MISSYLGMPSFAKETSSLAGTQNVRFYGPLLEAVTKDISFSSLNDWKRGAKSGRKIPTWSRWPVRFLKRVIRCPYWSKEEYSSMSKEHSLLVFLTNISLRRTSSWGNSTSRLRRLAMHLVQVCSIHFHSWNIFRWAFTNALKVRLRSNKEASLALHPRTQTDVRRRNHSPCTRCQISYLLGQIQAQSFDLVTSLFSVLPGCPSWNTQGVGWRHRP